MKKEITKEGVKKDEPSDFGVAVFAVIASMLAIIGLLFVLYHSPTVLGFVFRPWLQETGESAAVQKLRHDMRYCAQDWNTISTASSTLRISSRPTTPQELVECLKRL